MVVADLFSSALALAIGPVNTTFAVPVTVTVPECAVIVKLVNSTRHEFQIVPVKCPAPKDYWLTSSQMVYFESSDLIEVTRQKDVVIGSLVKFVLPSEAEVRRFTRGARGRIFGNACLVPCVQSVTQIAQVQQIFNVQILIITKFCVLKFIN